MYDSLEPLAVKFAQKMVSPEYAERCRSADKFISDLEEGNEDITDLFGGRWNARDAMMKAHCGGWVYYPFFGLEIPEQPAKVFLHNYYPRKIFNSMSQACDRKIDQALRQGDEKMLRQAAGVKISMLTGEFFYMCGDTGKHPRLEENVARKEVSDQIENRRAQLRAQTPSLGA